MRTPGKEQICLLNHDYQDEIRRQFERFVSCCNGIRYYEEIGNVAPDGV